MQITQDKLNELLEQENQRKSKLRSNLHNSEVLLLDLFMDNNGTRQPPRYVENIQWFIENIENYSNINFIKLAKRQLAQHIEFKNNFSIKEVHSFPSEFKNLLFSNEMINKRMENLLKNHEVKDWFFFKKKFIRNGNKETLKCLYQFGFNPLTMKNFMVECIEGYNLPLANEIIVNPIYGWNYLNEKDKIETLFSLIKNKGWKNIQQIIQTDPQLFTITDSNQDNFLFNLSQLNKHKTLFDKERIKKEFLNPVPNYMKIVIKDIFYLYEKENKPINSTGLCTDIIELYRNYLHENLNKSIDNSNITKIKKMKL